LIGCALLDRKYQVSIHNFACTQQDATCSPPLSPFSGSGELDLDAIGMASVRTDNLPRIKEIGDVDLENPTWHVNHLQRQ